MWDILELKLALGKKKRSKDQNGGKTAILVPQYSSRHLEAKKWPLSLSSFSSTTDAEALRAAYLCDLREEISDDENLIGLEKEEIGK